MMKEAYSEYIREHNVAGSNKASSYIRALDLLDGILQKSPLFDYQEFWLIDSVEAVNLLYEFALANQAKDGRVFLNDSLPPSYGRNGYYSAALKSYKEFLVLQKHQSVLWHLYNELNVAPAELCRQLSGKDIQSIEELVTQKDVDLSSREGKEVVREIKERVNQDFFRKMILADYHQQCCVTGLNIPDVLRASHIVAWKDDVQNRLNPANGLCLSATYDAAFDRHLISFDEEFKMILSPSLKEYHSNKAFQTQFKAFEGRQLLLPKRYSPGQEFLAKHRERLVA